MARKRRFHIRSSSFGSQLSILRDTLSACWQPSNALDSSVLSFSVRFLDSPS